MKAAADGAAGATCEKAIGASPTPGSTWEPAGLNPEVNAIETAPPATAVGGINRTICPEPPVPKSARLEPPSSATTIVLPSPVSATADGFRPVGASATLVW